MWQANWVADQLGRQDVKVELVSITTSGDVQSSGPIAQIGSQGVFTKEIQKALLDRRIDLAVHSLKDLSTFPTPGLVLAAVPRRGPVADVLVFRDPRVNSLDDLPRGACVATGSVRRRVQLLHARPDLQIENLRGNVETRLAKLDAGPFDAIVLAEAGLRRLGFDSRIGQILDPSLLLPAIGQGALAIEIRDDDSKTREAVQSLNDPMSYTAVAAERTMLATLEGGCSAPIGGWARNENDRLILSGRVSQMDGSKQLDETDEGSFEDPDALGRLLAERLLQRGAGELICEARQS